MIRKISAEVASSDRKQNIKRKTLLLWQFKKLNISKRINFKKWIFLKAPVKTILLG